MDDYKRLTRESYNTHAEHHASRFRKLFDLARRDEFTRFIDLLPDRHERGFTRRYILDLGCGAGDHAAYFTEKGLGVTAIDFSQEMVRLCKQRGLDACVMDIEDLKFEHALFHGVWSVTSLLHIPKKNLPKVADKLHDILKKDGILYVCIKEGEGERSIPDRHDPSTQRYFAFWKEQELHNVFSGGFHVLESRVIPRGETRFIETFFRKK